MKALLTSASNLLRYKARHNFLVVREIQRLTDWHHLSSVELLEVEEELFLRQFRKAFKHSGFYQRLYADYGIDSKSIGSIDDLSKLPIVDKAMVRAQSDAILTTSKRWLAKGYTSGTTGSPLTVYRDFKSILLENAYLWHFRQSHGLNIKDPVVCLRGNLGRETVSRYNKAENILYLSSYHLNAQHAPEYLRLITSFAPKALWGYPSSLEILATLFERMGVTPKVPLAFTSSETLYQFQVDKFARVFGAKTFDWYGNAERTIAIEQCRMGAYHLVPGYGYTEFETDSVITTSFINSAFPLIRYRVTDSIQPAEVPCSCGHPGRTIAQIEGRIDDCLLLPDGTSVGRMDVAFKGVNHVEFAQLLQESVEHVDVHLVKSVHFSATDEQRLLTNLRARIGNEITIQIRYVNPEDIIRTKAGKYKLVISKLITNLSPISVL